MVDILAEKDAKCLAKEIDCQMPSIRQQVLFNVLAGWWIKGISPLNVAATKKILEW